jgi:predicted phosphoadenosine phosphosulfate sulfurtransferase
MPVIHTGRDVFDDALMRTQALYEEGHRVVVSFSAGKDSGIILELAILAAEATGNLPVDVVMRDEEIMFPGTYEYAERVAARPEVNFHWIYACQPVLNVFDRANPYFWVFDPLLEPEQWVRQPPDIAKRIPEHNINQISNLQKFPPAEGKKLYVIMGLRVSESSNRRAGLHSSGGYRTIHPDKGGGFYKARPIYDWEDGDVWKAVQEFQWDYNTAYDVMFRHGMAASKMRIAPPTMNRHGIDSLNMARKAWPRWFNRVADRLNGVRTAAQFGKRAVQPYRKQGETWEECFYRTCVDEAPDWIAKRAKHAIDKILARHSRHATTPFPQITKCLVCDRGLASWKKVAHDLYDGDPWGVKLGPQTFPARHPDPALRHAIDSEYFRPGSGTWGGSPGW